MTSVSDIVLRGICYALVGLTAWESARGWLRFRDRYRADILWVVGLLVLILLLGDTARAFASSRSAIGFLFSLAFLTQPVFLLRLVSRFRHVAPAHIWLSLAIAIGGSAVSMVTTPSTPGGWTLVVAAYFFLQLGWASWAFGVESRRAGGVTGHRLWFAGAGTSIHAVIAIVIGVEALYPGTAAVSADLRRFLGLMVFGCYYLGLVAPRRLRAIWAQRELYQHMRLTSDRQPDERAYQAAADLSRAAGQGVASVGRAVLLFDEAQPDLLVTRATNLAAWSTLTVRPGAGLIGRSLARATAAAGAPGDFEPEIAQAAASLGHSAWSVPLVSAGRRWGVLLVVQRYGSLFPDDDLEFLGVLCGHTAGTLEYARLALVERQLHAQTTEVRLRDSEVRFSQVMQTLRDYAVFVLDQAGRVVDWRAGADTIFGYTAADIAGQSAHVLLALDPRAFEALLATARDAGHVNDNSACRRSDGSTFFSSTAVRPIVPGSNASGFVVVVRDETERRALDARLQHAQKMEAVGQLAGGVAHDFNNLLTVVLGQAEAIASHPAYNPALDEHIDEIRRIAAHATGLTRRLLAFSRREVVQPRPVNLPRVVADLVPMLGRVLHERIQLSFEAETSSGWTIADPVQIEQVVLNLAVNARDAMHDGGRLDIRTGAVTTTAPLQAGDATLGPGPYLTLTVCDTGVGMDSATRARIFEPFFTTKEIGRGTGLGLSTVYGIVKQINGAVHVTSAVGQGTTFQVFLPEVPEPATATADVVTYDSAPASESILLVEDDEAIRRLMRSWLTRRGYTVIAAGNATDALKAVAAHPNIDIIVTDVMMPGLNGPELVKLLQNTRPDLPALYVSGYAHDVLTTERLLSAEKHFLSKPFTNEELHGRIRQILAAGSENRSRL